MNGRLVRAAQHAAQGNIDGLFDLFYGSKDIFIDVPRSSSTSALSIVLFLLPEYIDPSLYAERIHDLFVNPHKGKAFEEPHADIELPKEHLEARSRGISELIQKQSAKYGWSDSDDTYSTWVKIRLKLIDFTGGPLRYFQQFCQIEPVAYCTGIVAVVMNYCEYFNTSVSLAQFDSQNPQQNVEVLLQYTSPETIVRDVETLVIPYLEFTCSNDMELLNNWVSNVKDLHLLVLLSNFRQLVSPILKACYSNNIQNMKMWDLLSEIASNMDRLNLPEVQEDSKTFDLDNISNTWLVSSGSANSVRFFQNLVENGQLVSEIKSEITFIDIVRIRFGNEQIQQDLADQLILEYENKHKRQSFGILKQILDSLKKGKLLYLVSSTYLNERLLSSSLKAAHFEFARGLESTVSSFEPLVLNAFETFFNETSDESWTQRNLKNAAACLELLETSKWANDDDVKRANALMRAINKFFEFLKASRQKLPTRLADLKLMDPFEFAGMVLELNSQAYQKFDQLLKMTTDFIYGISYVTNESDNTVDTPAIKIRAMCVDAALANNDFATAYNYCVPQLSTLQNSQVAWTACFQVGKYVSAYWEETPPVSVFTDQMYILSCSLEICPNDNISQIIEVWKRLERLSKTANYSSMVMQNRLGGSRRSSSSLGRQSISPQPEGQLPARKRDQISNLLVSGLGWAIGANQTR